MAFIQNSEYRAAGKAEVTTTPAIFIHDDTHPRASIVHIFGEATFADTAQLESMIVGAIRIGRPVIIDLRECRYVDCAAIGVIVRAAKNLNELLRLAVPHASQAYRMLELTRLVHVLHVYQTLDEAIAPRNTNPMAMLRCV
jgi:anti-anti-sigma factor